MPHRRRPGVGAELVSDSSAIVDSARMTESRSDPRQRLLDAMIETVALRGYDRTTVSRVLSSAAVEEIVFSEHFRDKHDCFMQAVEDLIGGAERAALECFQQPSPWHERMRLALACLLDALFRNPDGARVVLVEMLSAGPDACERHRSALALCTSLVEQGRSQVADAEHLPPQTSEAIVGGITSIVHRRVLQGDTTELPALHADLTYFALLPYLAHERALEVVEPHLPENRSLLRGD